MKGPLPDFALSRNEKLVLQTCVNPAHLQPDAMTRVRAQMDSCVNRHAVIDEFLLPAHLDALRELVAQSDRFAPNLKVSPRADAVAHLSEAERRRRVEQDLFETAPDEDRFIAQEIYRPAETVPADDRPARTDILVRQTLSSGAMHSFMGAMAGTRLCETMPINLKRHHGGHFLRRHSDANGQRKLCGVLYLHDDWQPAYGGRFVLYRDGLPPLMIDPLPNRLIIFDVTVKNDHAIEDIADAPQGWWRSNYSVWFR